MDKDRLKELAAGYSLGALSESDHKAFDQLLRAGDEEALEALSEMMVVAEQLPSLADPVPPPPALKSRILNEINADQAPARQNVTEMPTAQPIEGASRTWLWALAAAALILACGWALHVRSLQQQVDMLAAQNEINAGQIEQLRQELARREQTILTMSGDNTTVIAMAPQAVDPDARGQLFFDADRNRAVFFSSGLPDIDENKVYQMWMLRGAEAISAGLIAEEKDGEFSIEFDTLPDDDGLTAFAVSLEPQGGVPSPTGDIYLVGVVPSE